MAELTMAMYDNNLERALLDILEDYEGMESCGGPFERRDEIAVTLTALGALILVWDDYDATTDVNAFCKFAREACQRLLPPRLRDCASQEPTTPKASEPTVWRSAPVLDCVREALTRLAEISRQDTDAPPTLKDLLEDVATGQIATRVSAERLFEAGRALGFIEGVAEGLDVTVPGLLRYVGPLSEHATALAGELLVETGVGDEVPFDEAAIEAGLKISGQ